MGNFNRDRRSGAGRSFDRQPVVMHRAVCDKCGKECEVPFRPSGSKPVYCNDCFRSQGGSDNRRSDDRNFSRPRFDNRNQRPQRQDQQNYRGDFQALNTKLDKILQLLNPSVSSPVVESVEVEKVQPEEVVVLEKKPRSPRKKVIAPVDAPQE